MSDEENEMWDDLAGYLSQDKATIFKSLLRFAHANMKEFETAYPDLPGWTTYRYEAEEKTIDWLTVYEPARMEKRQEHFRRIKAMADARLEAQINKGVESPKGK